MPVTCFLTKIGNLKQLLQSTSLRFLKSFEGNLVRVDCTSSSNSIKEIIFYKICRGSASFEETMTSTFPSNKSTNLPLNSVRKPRSVLLCSHKITCTPRDTASKMSWCDISPVRYTSACFPRSTLAPEPAHRAIVWMELWSGSSDVLLWAAAKRICLRLRWFLIRLINSERVTGECRVQRRPWPVPSIGI